MKMLGKKGILTTLLLVTLLVGSVSAWTVLTAETGAGAKYTVSVAEASVGNAGWIPITPNPIGSGYEFTGTASATITITNAKELVVTFSITEYEAAEWEAIASGTLTITETGIAEIGTINLISLSAVQVTLAEGTHTIRYDVVGVAGYPVADQYVEFLVAVDVATP